MNSFVTFARVWGLSVGWSETLRSHLQNGRKRVHRQGLLAANQQVGFREMLGKVTWSHSPSSRMSTGATHLHGDRPVYLSA